VYSKTVADIISSELHQHLFTKMQKHKKTAGKTQQVQNT